MSWAQVIFGIVLVVVLLFVAVLYGVRQITALRRLRAAEETALEEHDYLHGRAQRRLLMSLLLLLLGVMLTVDLLYLEVPAQQLADQREAQEQEEDSPPLNAEQRSFARVYGGFFLFFLLVLMVVVFMAAIDVWATRRYSLRQHRKLMADRRAMIERELSRRRQEGNGHH